ncbi:peptidylprolyl isomerase [Undibacterium sp. TC4M20W]|uniref:peptidylprolyl isomerase n=1 Tax=unclassified Undibacterium TaxID=2630295 RepID=UPI003BF16F3A
MIKRFLCLTLFLFTATSAVAQSRYAIIETSEGNIKIELNARQSPKTVAAFIKYVQAGIYRNSIVHRAVKDFVIQGGELMKATPGERNEALRPDFSLPVFLPEVKNGLKNQRGTIAMTRARVGNNELAPTGFFINLKDNQFLNYYRYEKETMVPTQAGPQLAPAGTEISGYAVFGRVVEGMTVADQIAQTAVEVRGLYEHMPVQEIVIKQIRLSDK